MRALLPLLLGLAAPAHAQAAPDVPPPSAWNVLVITLDAARPDRMGLYGHDRDTTPYLERLAEESVVFDNAFATGAWTSPGIASLWTGLSSPAHGQNTRFDDTDDTLVTPLDVLRKTGRTPIAREFDSATVRGLGFRAAYMPVLRHGPEVVHWLAERTSPWVAWVHVKGTHLPYDPPPYHLRRFRGDRLDTPAIRAVRESGTVYPQDYGLSWDPPVIEAFTAEEQAVVRDLYDGAMAAQDDEIGRMLEHLRQVGQLDRTLIVLTADHGEELFDHGWVGHASTGYQGKVFDELIRIPLIIRVPGGTTTGRVDALVQHDDLMPTMLELLQVDPAPIDGPMEGRSLVADMRGETPADADELVFTATTFKGWTTPLAETTEGHVAVRSWDRKLIRTRRDGTVTTHAYDLAADPGETEDLWPTQAERFADLDVALDERLDRAVGIATARLELAAERRLDQLREAARDGDAVAAADAWSALTRIERTWRTEWRSPFEDPAVARRWRRTLATAARLRDRALR